MRAKSKINKINNFLQGVDLVNLKDAFGLGRPRAAGLRGLSWSLLG